jgi:hypothetical protein
VVCRLGDSSARVGRLSAPGRGSGLRQATGGTRVADAEQGIVTGGGVGARINLFGYAVLEVDYVRAFELGAWNWQLILQPGF